MSLYNQLLDNLNEKVERKATHTPDHLQKSKRPLKMPKNYDFSVRNVDWRQYERDFLLRTDAVWERSKLMDVFYTHYKSQFIYDRVQNKYLIANIRQMPLPTNEPEHFEDWRPFMGYTDTDGCVVSEPIKILKKLLIIVAIQSWTNCVEPSHFLRFLSR
jgi:hypothetical protein